VVQPETRDQDSTGATDGNHGEKTALTESAELYQRLVEANPDAVFRLRIRPEVRVEYLNAAAERILGHPLETLRSAGLDFLREWFADDELDSILDVAAGRRFFPVAVRRMRRADGSLFWAEIHNVPIYDESATIVAHEGTIRDVSDRENALAAWRAAEEKQRRITESLPELLFKVDEAGKLFEQIPTASRQPSRVFLERPIAEIVPEDSRSDAAGLLKKALAGTPGTMRCQVTVFGDERAYEIRLLPCGSGELLAFLRDVTDEVWATAEHERRAARAELEGTVERQLGIKNPYEFTVREFTVLHMLVKGFADKEIANELGVVPSTVHKHVSHILGKMGANSRTEASVRAVQEGLV
jgi:PAS domain S-box-containing protein